ncbi:MAG: hypothetical protein V4479_01950 [Actinomycetota bacterium]
MSQVQIVSERLAPLRDMLNVDGYDLVVHDGADGLVAEITAGEAACEDCLVPKHVMRQYVDTMLEPEYGSDAPQLELVYPADAGH